MMVSICTDKHCITPSAKLWLEQCSCRTSVKIIIRLLNISQWLLHNCNKFCLYHSGCLPQLYTLYHISMCISPHSLIRNIGIGVFAILNIMSSISPSSPSTPLPRKCAFRDITSKKMCLQRYHFQENVPSEVSLPRKCAFKGTIRYQNYSAQRNRKRMAITNTFKPIWFHT